jgi:hypothetical protein
MVHYSPKESILDLFARIMYRQFYLATYARERNKRTFEARMRSPKSLRSVVRTRHLASNGTQSVPLRLSVVGEHVYSVHLCLITVLTHDTGRTSGG